MFKNLFKRKKTDKEVIAYLREITQSVNEWTLSSFQEYIDKFDSNEDCQKIKKTALFCFSLLMVSSGFLLYSKRSNKTEIIDELTLSMIKEWIGYQENTDRESLNKFISKYQGFYSYCNTLFLNFLKSNNPQSDEFIIYFCKEVFPAENEIWKMILARRVAIHIKTLKECVDEEMG